MKARIIQRSLIVLGLVAFLGAGQGCSLGTKHGTNNNSQAIIGESYQSECLDGAGLDDGVRGEVEIRVEGHSVQIIDHNAEFNCCLDAWMQASIRDNRIVVVEVEDPDDENACDCTCSYELSIGISNLADSEYMVEVYRGTEDPQALIHQESVCLGECSMECEVAGDCLEQTWGIYCQGHWSCNEGTCEEVCDMETCGDGTCDSEVGENLESCRVDCENHDVTLVSFQPSSCGECGAQECYEPDAPLGESTFEYSFEADPDNPGHYLVRAVHHVSCIDVAILGAEFESHGDELVLTETFDYDNPVDCYCNYQADIVLAGLLPGTYELKIYDNDQSHLLMDQGLVIEVDSF